ncbi:MAG: M50 family metallopeptidase [Elusimicrobiaceae bacterium]|nr:M50 family metallopeptidase [Elusimicrobiaceae bacterium]
MKKFLKLLLGLILLPSVLFFFYDFMEVLLVMIKNFRLTFSLIIGVAAYLICHKYIYNFSRVYVFAHEITHAIAAWCCGYKVSNIKVNKESGHTTVSDVNTFVLLAPYCIPVYAIICILGFYITSLFWKEILTYDKVFLGILGFLMTLHLVHTYKSLTETEQSDISSAGGGIFSFVLIVLANLTLAVLLIKFLFPSSITPSSIFWDVVKQTCSFWKMFYIYLRDFIVWLKNL